MKQSLILYFVILYSAILNAQVTGDVRLESSSKTENRVCYNMDVRQSGDSETVMLAGQNYRLFYNSEALSFDDSGWNMKLNDSEYTSNLVQHRNQVDASKVGILSFDKNLGFINASVILNGTDTRGVLLPKNTWKTLAEVCFDIIDNEIEHQVVIARPQLTSGYGRAYVELSYVDEHGSIQSLPILSAQDIGR